MSAATQFSLIYLAAAVAGFGAFLLVWPHRAASGGRPLALMLLAASVWALGDALELQAPTVGGKQLVSQFQYIGVVAAAPLFFHAAWLLSGRRGPLRFPLRLAVWTVPVLSLALAWTNSWHHWLWRAIEAPADGSPFSTYRYGWWFWVFTAQNYALMTAATVMLMRAIRQVGRHFRPGMALMVVATALPWVGNLAYNFKLGPLPGLNWLTLALGVSGALLAWLVRHQGLLDVVPPARYAMLDMLGDGVLLIGVSGETLFANRAAERVMALDDQSLAGALGVASLADAPADTHAELLIGEVWFDVRVGPVADRWGRFAARLVVARDITSQKRLQDERERLIRELQDAVAKVSQLEGLLPVCASCHKIREDGGYWAHVEEYLGRRSAVEFTHGICPDCVTKLYPEAQDEPVQTWGLVSPGDAKY